MTVKTEHSTYHNCHLVKDYFVADDSLSLEVWTKEEPVARLTKCLCDATLFKNEAYVDVNNCPWAEDFIKQYKLGVSARTYAQSGYCTYPLYRFNLDEIAKYT